MVRGREGQRLGKHAFEKFRISNLRPSCWCRPIGSGGGSLAALCACMRFPIMPVQCSPEAH